MLMIKPTTERTYVRFRRCRGRERREEERKGGEEERGGRDGRERGEGEMGGKEGRERLSIDGKFYNKWAGENKIR